MVTKILFCLELLVGNVVKKIIDPYLYTSFVLPKGKKNAVCGNCWSTMGHAALHAAMKMDRSM
jgi:hypothetical protein